MLLLFWAAYRLVPKGYQGGLTKVTTLQFQPALLSSRAHNPYPWDFIRSRISGEDHTHWDKHKI